jgi:hypothetical protein
LGESWKPFNLITDIFPPCTYTGAKAKAEFAALTGCSANIPLEENSLPEFPDDFGDIAFDCRFWDPYVLLLFFAVVFLKHFLHSLMDPFNNFNLLFKKLQTEFA